MTESFCDDCMARQKSTNPSTGCGAGSGWNAGAWTLGGGQQGTLGQQPSMSQQAPLPQSLMQQPMQPMGTTSVGPGMAGMAPGQQQSGMAFPSPVPGVDFNQVPGSPVFQGEGYTQGFLRRNIGRNIRVEFLIGTNLLTDRTGTLLEVGISYIVLKPTGSDDQLMCDIYSIVFVNVFY